MKSWHTVPNCYGCRYTVEKETLEMYPVLCVPALLNGKKVWACPSCGALLGDCMEDDPVQIEEAALADLRKQEKWRVVKQMSALSLDVCDIMTKTERLQNYYSRHIWVNNKLQAEFITVQDSALLLSCSPDAIRRMIKKGELKAYKRNNRYLIRKEDLLNVPVLVTGEK